MSAPRVPHGLWEQTWAAAVCICPYESRDLRYAPYGHNGAVAPGCAVTNQGAIQATVALNLSHGRLTQAPLSGQGPERGERDRERGHHRRLPLPLQGNPAGYSTSLRGSSAWKKLAAVEYYVTLNTSYLPGSQYISILLAYLLCFY
jgi:hypothetical protein